jgi:glycosyltransferase involved in cell wall biosynthesis
VHVKVSIVIPCFNQAAFLAEAIESALAQTWPHVEVVVVDDGSTDDSAAVARRYPVRLVQQPNSGVSSARNAGLSASTGDAIVFLDADDRLRAGAAAHAAAVLRARPEAMLAFGRCASIDDAGRPLPAAQPPVAGDPYHVLLGHNCIWTPAAAAFRRRVFDDVGGFDPAVGPSADYDMYLRVASRFPVAVHDAIVADYRQHDGSMSGDPVLMLETSLAVLGRQRRPAAADPRTRRAWEQGMAYWRYWYGERLVERFRAAIRTRGRRAEAIRWAWHLVRLYPAGVLRHLRRKIASLMRRPSAGAGGDASRSRAADDRFRSTHTSHSPSR